MPLVRVATLLLAVALTAAATPLTGTYALQQGVARTQAFMRAIPSDRDPLRVHFDLWTTPAGSTAPIRTYRRDMTKLLHLIIVRDDFAAFEHVHPLLDSDGHFWIDLSFRVPGRYHVYFDARPERFGQQVFRFELAVGAAPARPVKLPGATRSVEAGPYHVELDRTELRAGREEPLVVHVRKNGGPARDLHPYLGALAHAVLISTSDVSYVHAHPMPLGAMGGMNMGEMPMDGMEPPPLPDGATSAPDMQFHLAVRDRGTYVLWLQFRGADTIYIVPFRVSVR